MKRTTISDNVKSFLQEEVANCCPLCGKFERTGAEMTNHHINHDPSISEYWNLIRVCKRCHKDLTKYRNDGERECRVKRVKRHLFRNYFGPEACNAIVLAATKGKITCSPVTALMIARRGYLRMFEENVFTVGPATNITSLDTYEITNEGKDIVDKLRLAAMFGA